MGPVSSEKHDAVKSWLGEIPSLSSAGLSNHQPYPQLLTCAPASSPASRCHNCLRSWVMN